jgi:hypothetical protein
MQPLKLTLQGTHTVTHALKITFRLSLCTLSSQPGLVLELKLVSRLGKLGRHSRSLGCKLLLRLGTPHCVGPLEEPAEERHQRNKKRNYCSYSDHDIHRIDSMPAPSTGYPRTPRNMHCWLAM